MVQRTSAGTQGVVGATHAERLWVASLVCASATAGAVLSADLGDPSYVITGCFADAPDTTGDDDDWPLTRSNEFASDTIRRQPRRPPRC